MGFLDDLGGFDFPSGGGGAPSGLDLGSLGDPFRGGGASVGDFTTVPSFVPGQTGSGSGFSFPGLDAIGKGIGLGADVLKAGGGIWSAVQNANYQNSLKDYYNQRAKAEAAYNQQVQDYLQQRGQWEQNLMGQFGEQQQSLQDALLTF